MQPVLRSFLAEISANWLRTTKRRPFQTTSIGSEQQSAGTKDRQQMPSRRPQTACYVPPPPRSGDIASNM